ncbi:hypothetical protein [Sphingobacterium chungjuense]|uniref:hypothetical protein n=1 Tax=Sphingobacterium chungjuense TaxID=2675553 RepID=UPI0014075E5F|nr:hypothetical protein [Sphingobacterium chungjuense]
MSNKLGFDLGIAFIALPIGLALLREFNFKNLAFDNTSLGMLYFIAFVVTIYFMLKKKSSTK